MIEFTILGGYLGAGKTTLLNHILQHNEDLRLALLINDFGSINIDAALIESQDEQQINLANGCVCCNLSDGFFEALETLKEMAPPPDHIIVEASGVADVHNLSQYGYTADLQLSGLIVLADAETIRTKADDKYVAETVRRQLRAADLIVLNKIDLVSKSQLSATLDWLSDFNTCPVMPTERGVVPLTALLGVTSNGISSNEHFTHAHYETWQLSNDRAYAEETLKAFIQRVANALRLKGIVRNINGGSIEVQVVGKRVELTTKDADVERSQLVAIGLADQFDPKAVDAIATELLNGSVPLG
jgi:G3E family GTPase